MAFGTWLIKLSWDVQNVRINQTLYEVNSNSIKLIFWWVCYSGDLTKWSWYAWRILPVAFRKVLPLYKLAIFSKLTDTVQYCVDLRGFQPSTSISCNFISSSSFASSFEFAAMLKMRLPKQSHNALWQPSRPGLSRNLKVANRSCPSCTKLLFQSEAKCEAIDIKMIEKKVNENTYDVSSIKRVTKKFLEVSSCSRAKQR